MNPTLLERFLAAFISVRRRALLRWSAFRRSRIGRWFFWTSIAGLTAAALGCMTVLGVYIYYSQGLPTIESMQNYRPPQISRIVDRKGQSIAESYSERRTVVSMERVPRVLVLSVLAAEDADFYRHRGLDYLGLMRAVFKDLTSGARQGASTITQQIVKTMLLTPERRFSRKIREIILTRRLETELTKDQILSLYLNQINFGHAYYGVEEASRFYFNKHVEELTLSEASLLAGVPQNPSRLSPLAHPEAARRRQMYVLSQLKQKRAQYWDDLKLEDIEKAEAQPAVLAQREAGPQSAPEAATLAKDMLLEAVGSEAVNRGGYTVETTIDLNLQQLARAALRAGLVRIDERHNLQAPLRAPKKPLKLERVPALVTGRNYDAIVRGTDTAKSELILDVGGNPARAGIKDLARWNPKGLDVDSFAEPGAVVKVVIDRAAMSGEPARARLSLGPQGAVVVIDPRTREVLAMVGSDEASYGFNRATQAIRQPGSTWKPIEFALALDTRKFTPASVLLDAPEVYDEWKPNNYETWHYTGAVRLREALAQSINLVAIRVVSELTPVSVVEFARHLGITTDLDPSLALALGASGVRPIELVNAYATFAAGGKYQPTRLLRKISDPAGHDVKLKPAPAPEQALTPEGAYLITNLMTSVVQSGTGKAALALKRPIAGKTGTSNKVRDAWFVGFTPELVAGVWVGYDDLRPLGPKESGANSALPIWMEIMKQALKDRPAVDFPMPSGLTITKIDPKTGKLAYDGQPDGIDEVFLDGTVPTEIATPPDVLDTGSFMMEQLGENTIKQ